MLLSSLRIQQKVTWRFKRLTHLFEELAGMPDRLVNRKTLTSWFKVVLDLL